MSLLTSRHFLPLSPLVHCRDTARHRLCSDFARRQMSEEVFQKVNSSSQIRFSFHMFLHKQLAFYIDKALFTYTRRFLHKQRAFYIHNALFTYTRRFLHRQRAFYMHKALFTYTRRLLNLLPPSPLDTVVTPPDAEYAASSRGVIPPSPRAPELMT